MLLTRSPLVYPRRGLTVRLACVKHAASVRPEPGSNSPLKNIAKPGRNQEQRQKQRVQPPTEPNKLGQSTINLKGTHTQTPPTTHNRQPAEPRHEVTISAYLALTLSTLLSSQDSLTHRTRLSHPAWGNSLYITGIRSSFQIELLHPPSWRSGTLRIRCSLTRPSDADRCIQVGCLRIGHLIRRSCWRLGVLHSVKAWTTLRGGDVLVNSCSWGPAAGARPCWPVVPRCCTPGCPTTTRWRPAATQTGVGVVLLTRPGPATALSRGGGRPPHRRCASPAGSPRTSRGAGRPR